MTNYKEKWTQFIKQKNLSREQIDKLLEYVTSNMTKRTNFDGHDVIISTVPSKKRSAAPEFYVSIVLDDADSVKVSFNVNTLYTFLSQISAHAEALMTRAQDIDNKDGE